MSKIYLRGREPITTDKKTANKIKIDWVANPKSQDIVNVEGDSFKLKDINSINVGLDEGRDYSTMRYDLDNPKDRQEVKDFENEYLTWKKENEYNNLISLEKFLETKGACKIRSELPTDTIITNSSRYEKLTALWSAVQILRRRRSKAEEYKIKDLEKIAQTIK